MGWGRGQTGISLAIVSIWYQSGGLAIHGKCPKVITNSIINSFQAKKVAKRLKNKIDSDTNFTERLVKS